MNDTAKKNLDSADIMRVLELLPHRYPFLLVDRIIEIDGDDSCIGIKNVSINEPQFQGHFPDRPIMPGVLIIEGMAQTAGAMCIHELGTEKVPKIVYFMTIDKAKFRKTVHPGDQMHYVVKKIRRRSTIWKFDCKALVNGVVVATAELSAMIADA
ncbi:MAG: 3-hydroxyacyl-ACP dehydratase FabZ [Fimbriimonadaceae bacterium]|nr:3-hydroxyacyl-ACP dehydratase FabZ [Alphaproteobacteria bacterium]